MKRKLKFKMGKKTANEDGVQADQIPLIVIITASWCGNSQIMAPMLERLEGKYGKRLKFISVDVDTQLPILLFFRDGTLENKLKGAIPFSMLDNKIKEFLMD
jgi:thiol-disulfide isomerase/thioredoxin